jgi:alkylated DNA repair dioxygenase AlkB
MLEAVPAAAVPVTDGTTVAPVETETGIAVVADPVVERVQLDDASWVDVARGWLAGADALHDDLVEHVAWGEERLYRYDHWITSPRLGAFWTRGQPVPHPALLEAHRWLQQRYGVQFEGFALARYRHGDDGQAFHRDRSMRWLDETVVAVLSLGAQRPWYLRPRTSKHSDSNRKGATHDFAPASGDLLVMGGACQARWEHSVPQLPGSRVGDRISVQWRWTSRRGRPEVGANYGAPRHYDR